jgi:CheY-like chemotaxis protein
MTRRVAVVDDDDVNRRGLVGLLEDQPEIEVVAALTHDQALVWNEEWDRVDVAIVDACDERQPEDHFPGVAVVQGIRRRRTSEQTRVVIRTGQFFDDAVRRRMGEARADYFFHRSELQDAADLRDVVLCPERFRRGVPGVADPEVLIRLGVSKESRVNAAVDDARASGLVAAARNPGQRGRTRTRQRQQFNRVARLSAMNSDGTVPDRNQPDPSLPQIRRFLDWATRDKNGGRGAF